MTGIENALQDLANIVTVITGAIVIYQFLKGKQKTGSRAKALLLTYLSYHNEKENANDFIGGFNGTQLVAIDLFAGRIDYYCIWCHYHCYSSRIYQEVNFMKSLEDVMTAKEAAERWDIAPITIRQACSGYKKAPPRFTAKEARKSAGTWLVTRAGMERLYGPEPGK